MLDKQQLDFIRKRYEAPEDYDDFKILTRLSYDGALMGAYGREDITLLCDELEKRLHLERELEDFISRQKSCDY